MVWNSFVTGVTLNASARELTFCKSCIYGKATCHPIVKVHAGKCAKAFSNKIHSNVWGPSPVELLQHSQMRQQNLYLMAHKSSTLTSYKALKVWCNIHHGATVKTLNSDQSGEYTGKEFVLYLKKVGTKQQLTVHDTPEHHSIAEQCNHTILEHTWAMLHTSNLPIF